MSAERASSCTLPCPPLTLSVNVSGDATANDAALLALPAKPGVLVIEDETGGTLSLLQTADLRRAARVRLGPVDPEQTKSRRVDLRSLARRVRAVTVGSTFDADWATLQLARVRLPHSYKSMLDRWQAWFVHCDPDVPFPQWIKTGHPSDDSGAFIGPFADKHAAARFREMLEDAFDLCRFQHILVQAPHGSACAYKEMGRCPAPCDGTVSLQDYHKQIRDSIAFAQQAIGARKSTEVEMARRGAALDFEGANRCKTLLERTAMCERHEFAQVRDFDAFRFLAVVPSEHQGFARIMAIVGGWVCPVIELPELPDSEALRAVLMCARSIAPDAPGRSEMEIENIGMTCRHLLLPKAQAKRRRAEFLHWTDQSPTAAMLGKAVVRVLREIEPVKESASGSPAASAEHELEING